MFEYWSHEACLLPIEDYPLFKRRMVDLSDRHWWGRERTAEGARSRREVLARICDEGALPARAFEGRSEPMWGWKPAKRALEHLFAAGEVAIAGRQGFQRVYDLPERVIPRVSSTPRCRRRTSSTARFALRAVQGRGALTEAGIAEHCRFRGGAMGPAARRRAGAEGLVDRVEVEDGGAPVVVPADAEIDGAPPARCSSARSTT